MRDVYLLIIALHAPNICGNGRSLPYKNKKSCRLLPLSGTPIRWWWWHTGGSTIHARPPLSFANICSPINHATCPSSCNSSCRNLDGHGRATTSIFSTTVWTPSIVVVVFFFFWSCYWLWSHLFAINLLFCLVVNLCLGFGSDFELILEILRG